MKCCFTSLTSNIKNMKRMTVSVLIFFMWISGITIINAGELENDYEVLFRNHGSAMIILDANTGEILDANAAALRFYGYNKAEMLDMSIHDINVLSKEKIEAEMKAAIEEERNYFVFRHMTKGLELKDVEVYSYPHIEEDGSRILYSIIHDITPRVQAEMSVKQISVLIYLIIIVALTILMFFNAKLIRTRKALKKSNLEYKDLFENMQSGFALHEIICNEKGEPVDYKFLEVNKAFEMTTSLKREDIIGKNVSEVLGEIEAYWIEKYGEVALKRTNLTYENYSKDLEKYFNVNAYSPSYGQFATIFNDVTEIKNTQKLLHDEREIFQTTLHSLGDAVISTDIEGRIKLFNMAAEHLLGKLKAEIVDKPFNDVVHFKNENNGILIEGYVEDVVEAAMTIEIIENVLLVTSTGIEIPVQAIASPIRDSSQNISGVVVTIKDFTEKREKQRQIEYLSYHDQLTGLYNRRFYEEELERLDTSRNLPFSLVMIDINGLKMTNDAFGHVMGDQLLVKFAEILKLEFREDDIIARIGGDEFVAILPSTSYEEAGHIVKRLNDTISKTQLGSIIISASIGWATKSDSDQEIEKVFKEAEEIMYKNKLLESKSVRSNTVHMIIKSLNEKSEIEAEHSRRVGDYCKQIGIALELDSEIVKEFEMLGVIHDIGKIAINNELLEKPSSLTDCEFSEIKRHVEIGYQILKSVDEYAMLAECILYHHERWDGKGYPRGLKMREIPLISRVISVADAYEAMTSIRPFRPAMTRANAIKELVDNAGFQFDPEIVNIFIKVLKNNNESGILKS